MTSNEEKAIRAMDQEQAVRDILACVSDVILKRPLSEQESHDLTIKIKFWFQVAFHKGKFAVQDSVRKFAEDSCKRIGNMPYLDAVGSDSCKVTTNK